MGWFNGLMAPSDLPEFGAGVGLEFERSCLLGRVYFQVPGRPMNLQSCLDLAARKQGILF